jgi:hypothetical protein
MRARQLYAVLNTSAFRDTADQDEPSPGDLERVAVFRHVLYLLGAIRLGHGHVKGALQ